MAEVQSHGFIFENWVKDTFFDSYRGGYSDKWDIPAKFNKKFGNLNVSIKTAKYGSTIGLGDALRQFDINDDFLIIVGFWKQNGKYKKIVNVSSVVVNSKVWRKLWQPVNFTELIKLDRLIKNTSLHYTVVRKMAQDLKKINPYSLCKITLNPKIDSKTQRRLQCGIKFHLYFEKIAIKHSSKIVENPSLFDITVPEPWESNSRKFNKKK